VNQYIFHFFHFSILIIFAFSKPKLVTGTLNDMYVDRHKQMHIPKLTLNQPFTKHFPSHFPKIFHLCHLGKSWVQCPSGTASFSQSWPTNVADRPEPGCVFVSWRIVTIGCDLWVVPFGNLT
jgi:hypothetical protein